jgi:hypothetical protein
MKREHTAIVVAAVIGAVGVVAAAYIQRPGARDEKREPGSAAVGKQQVSAPPAISAASAVALPPVDPSDTRVFVREASSREVMAAIEALPFLQRTDYAKAAYVGRWVRWSGAVVNVKASAGGGYYVALVDVGERYGIGVWLTLPASERVSVEPLREGDIIDYEGEIVGARHVDVDLSNGKIIRRRS